MSQELIVEDSGRVRTLRLNRPEVRNALTDRLAWDIVTAVEDAARDDDIWVVAITGSEGAFCAGLDLRNRGAGGGSPLSRMDEAVDDIGWVGRFLIVLREVCDKPVIAGINGPAAGAGLALAMACDMRLMARGAILIAGYPGIGASPDGGLTLTLQQAMGYEKTMRFLLENRTVGADEALELGLIGEVVDDDRFSDRLQEYSAFIAERAPIASRLTKRGVARAWGLNLTDHMRYELANLRRSFATDDSKEAIQGFLEKRPPEFRGR
ncbi:MAG: enoyl-CoA hydratase/isomerase family protein [Thermomicrobiales bacterium]